MDLIFITLEHLLPLLLYASFLVVPIVLIWKIIKRTQDRKQFEAETARMKAEAELIKARQEAKDNE